MFTFIGSAVFERMRSLYLDDEEYAELQQFIRRNPEAAPYSKSKVESVPGQILGQLKKEFENG